MSATEMNCLQSRARAKGSLERCIACFSRQILSRDEPPFVPDDELSVPRHMKITHDICEEVRIHARLREMQETVAQRIVSSLLGTLERFSHQDRDSQ